MYVTHAQSSPSLSHHADNVEASTPKPQERTANEKMDGASLDERRLGKSKMMMMMITVCLLSSVIRIDLLAILPYIMSE